jgi:hypothetical protein
MLAMRWEAAPWRVLDCVAGCRHEQAKLLLHCVESLSDPGIRSAVQQAMEQLAVADL